MAREFNAHFSGKPITVHAARKWLVSESIPTQDKLRSLAGWLGVSVEWLRFGGVARVLPNRDAANDVASPQDSLVRLYLTLPAREREIARDFVGMLVSKSRQRNENRATSGLVSITHR
ncbi:MAG: hypothetical protein H7327_02150 [Herminiimonas sp.]|nr:hypothetical protein [Herminiimonas sp.]